MVLFQLWVLLKLETFETLLALVGVIPREGIRGYLNLSHGAAAGNDGSCEGHRAL